MKKTHYFLSILTAAAFLLSSCANSSTSDSSDESSVIPTENGSLEFTGNITYDIGTLNEHLYGSPELVAGLIGASPAENTMKAILDFALSKAVIPAISAGASAGGTVVMSIILNQIGIKTQGANIADILDKIDDINNNLIIMQKVLDEIGKKIDDLKKEMEYYDKYSNYRDIIKKRHEYYINIYTNAHTLENTIREYTFDAAIKSEMDDVHTLDWLKQATLEEKLA